MENNPIIRLDNVCYAYEGIVALRHITLDIQKGETIILQGSNGCGKSTLLKLLNGLLFPEKGTFSFYGKPVTEKSMKDSSYSKWFHQKVGFIFQNSDVQLFCGSVQEEIAFGPRQMGLSETEISKRVEDVMQLLDIQKLRDRAPYHLSGGEKRKTAIGCILSMNPDVFVLDEPLAGLDKKTQLWLTGFLKALHKAGKTMIIATHNDILATELANRLIYMNDDHEIESIAEQLS